MDANTEATFIQLDSDLIGNTYLWVTEWKVKSDKDQSLMLLYWS